MAHVRNVTIGDNMPDYIENRLNVRLNVGDHKKLKRLAMERDVTVSAVVRLLIEKELDKADIRAAKAVRK